MWEVIKYLAGKLFDLAIKSDKLSLETLTKVAEMVVDDVAMRVQIIAQLHDMARRAEAVGDAFTPDGTVPDLLDGLDGHVVRICPEAGCSKRLDHEKQGDPIHGVDL